MATAKKTNPAPKRYWLFKSEPTAYSIHDLEREPKQTTFWDGVRNYQARNLLRDDVHVGDRVFFYHSNCDPLAITGTAEVIAEGYPDHTAWDKKSGHYDPKSSPENPAWYMVDIRLLKVFPQPITRESLMDCKELKEMMLLKRGSRLSIQPVTAAEWKAIHTLAGVADAKM
ncbi:MAG: EVE domain-containing protein [Planctomycetaceae bacterium]